jgi:hypothetical protein
MTTPKNPEEIVAELKFSEERVRAMYGTAVTVGEEWLRSSMASLLLWASEQMPEKDDLKRIERLYGLRYVNGEDKWGESVTRDVHQELHGRNVGITDCKALLTNEARKITEV